MAGAIGVLIKSLLFGILLSHRDKASYLTQQKANKKKNGRRAKERTNLFENHFRSGGEEKERRMENNVMKEMRVL